MTLIRHRLLIPEGSAELVRGVMREAKCCLDNEQKFDASDSHKGRTPLIKDGTGDSKLICV